jgi:riboflavin biosynthesis pyrimidine reductase
MGTRPYVLLSCAMSVDGFIDDTTAERLLLSNDADFDRVDQVRAESDAIMIGAVTLRRDNPRLLVNSPERRAEREARGLPPYPLKVTLTASGDLDPELKFWHHGGDKLVYAPDSAAGKVRDRLGELAEVATTGETLDFAAMLDDLGGRGIRRRTRYSSQSPRSSSAIRQRRGSSTPPSSRTAPGTAWSWPKSRRSET